MLLWELEREAQNLLTKAGVDSPGLCARVLTAHAAGLEKCAYISARREDASQKAIQLQKELVRRRGMGEPLAYILGKKEFYKSEFVVSNAVLTPRPETEMIVELALANLPETHIVFADVGCGSGCIGLSLLRERSQWMGLLLDSSAPALEIAKINAHGTATAFALADIFASPLALHTYDLIVSNPPYIGYGEREAVMPEVLAYEPHMALFSPDEGLAHIRAVIKGAGMALKSGGTLIMEHGLNQWEAIQETLRAYDFADFADHRDLAGLPRCLVARKN